MAKYKLQELNDLRDEGKRRVYPKMGGFLKGMK